MHKWLCWVLLAGWLGLGCDRKPAEPDRLSLAELQPPATPAEMEQAYARVAAELTAHHPLPDREWDSPEHASLWLRAYAGRSAWLASHMDRLVGRWSELNRADVLRWDALKRRAAEDDQLSALWQRHAVAVAEAKGIRPR